MWGLQALESLVRTAGTAFLLCRSLLFALKCPQAPLLLCTSCPWVFAALAPCLSGHCEMWPFDAHDLPSCSSCHGLSGEEPGAARGELSADQHDLVSGVQTYSVNPRKAHLSEAMNVSTVEAAPIDSQNMVPVTVSPCCGHSPHPPSVSCFSGCSLVISMFINADTLNCISSFRGTKCNPVPSFASPLPSCCPGNARCFDIITQPTGILSAPLTFL